MLVPPLQGRGDTPKLRGTPKASDTKPVTKVTGGQVNCLGYGKNSEDAPMGDPQPSSYRLPVWSHGEGSETRWEWVGQRSTGQKHLFIQLEPKEERKMQVRIAEVIVMVKVWMRSWRGLARGCLRYSPATSES